uniref:TFL1-like protein n=1 Tax=Cephalotaxus sinensis TaxID=89484 RepID=A0A1B1LTF6_9CONI|nr:TFL1-like protein [Cephalotaxus sinensis]
MPRLIRPLKLGGVIGDVLDVFTPTIKMSVVYNTNLQVKNGFEFMPSSISAPPKVDVVDGDLTTFFTLIMTDPDAPSPSNPTGREYLHWMVTDIRGTTSNYDGRDILSYEIPRPMIGIHRYVFTLFEQNERGTVEPPPSRHHFSTRNFAESNGMGLPVAAVYFNAQRETAARRR